MQTPTGGAYTEIGCRLFPPWTPPHKQHLVVDPLPSVCSQENCDSPRAFPLIFWHAVHLMHLCRTDANGEHPTFDFDVAPFVEVLGKFGRLSQRGLVSQMLD